MGWVGGGLLMLALGRGRRRGCGKRRLNMTSVSRVFVLENLTPATNFYPLKDSECSLMLSLIVFLRSWFIASFKVLNYNLEDHLTKVYDCVHFIQGRKKTFLLCFFFHSFNVFCFHSSETGRKLHLLISPILRFARLFPAQTYSAQREHRLVSRLKNGAVSWHKTKVTVNNNSPIQDYVHPDDQTQPFEMTPRFKPFTIKQWDVTNKVLWPPG